MLSHYFSLFLEFGDKSKNDENNNNNGKSTQLELLIDEDGDTDLAPAISSTPITSST